MVPTAAKRSSTEDSDGLGTHSVTHRESATRQIRISTGFSVIVA